MHLKCNEIDSSEKELVFKMHLKCYQFSLIFPVNIDFQREGITFIFKIFLYLNTLIVKVKVFTNKTVFNTTKFT